MTSAPQNPQEWISYLQGRLGKQKRDVARYQQYYDCQATPLAFAQKKFTEEFGRLFDDWRVPYSMIVVDAIAERLNVLGFRMNDEDAADTEANEIWQRCAMDAESRRAHTEALVSGQSFLKVWGDAEDQPVLSVESPTEMVVQYSPGSLRTVEAALKWFFDDWGGEWIELYLPSRLYKYNRPSSSGDWQITRETINPLKRVPVVPLANRTRIRRHPISEIEAIIPLEDAIAKLGADMLVASEFAAYPQRILSGLELIEGPDGELSAPIKSAIDRMLVFEDGEVKWGQFQSADLSNYVSAISLLTQKVCTLSRVPPHYMLINGGQAPSGESIQSAEAGLVSKVRERQIYFGDAWEEAMRLCFAVTGDDRAEAWSAEVIWDNPEHRSQAVATDAAVKLNQAGIIPGKQAAEDLGYTPAQIERFAAMLDEEQEHKLKQAQAMAEASALPGQPAGQRPDEKQPPSNRNNTARQVNERK